MQCQITLKKYVLNIVPVYYMQTKVINQALLMKVGWGLIRKKDSLWVCVLRNKYGYVEDVIPRVSRRNQNLNMWSGICKVWKRVEDGTSWRLGSGSRINFWNDCWCRTDLRLIDVATVPLDDFEKSKNVKDFVLHNGEWDVEKLKRMLPKDLCNWIVKSLSVRRGDMEDTILWNHHREVEFSIKSAYKFIAEKELPTRGNLLKLIWKWRGN